MSSKFLWEQVSNFIKINIQNSEGHFSVFSSKIIVNNELPFLSSIRITNISIYSLLTIFFCKNNYLSLVPQRTNQRFEWGNIVTMDYINLTVHERYMTGINKLSMSKHEFSLYRKAHIDY